ncbi:MAG TPA: hypothetical protein VJB90_02785, partial [Candidatus Nanoarchaeia archaeon]|nr:hypothetical protein [Candidatus Nanoarchaeia archaeon]
MAVSTNTAQIEERIRVEEERGKQILENGIFPLSVSTLKFVFDSLTSQIHHTEQIIKLASDQSKTEKLKLHQSLVTIRRLIKDRII